LPRKKKIRTKAKNSIEKTKKTNPKKKPREHTTTLFRKKNN
jgi:hypothetical protein